ncbi:MAG: tRNA (Guanine37-N1) -methyltransferase (EC [uncultured Campylobacterales bacterium]|uniref:tRNA (guanine-N(1)-)-methyltransferase n=1 Tax=uncultured Campylobacterales bacterium TaxID=352960 RepID=A0A6S6S5A1_9BACT|nr:MAG: tRNA (Guanine37-N1) -methyltransferase (EC [uncultured Campylobacterales bacterium]
MRINFITLFPQLIKSYFGDSILKNAHEKKLFETEYLNPRDFSTHKHKKVDAPMIGGGAGMLISPEVIKQTLNRIKEQTHIVFVTPSAKRFTQKDAKRLSTQKSITLVSGRYEGIDDRVIETYANEVFSIGDYILTGGELPSLIISDAILRNIPGILGNKDSLTEESFENGYLEAPNFTKPIIFEDLQVNSTFLKGNHSKISDLKNSMAKIKTRYFRPDIYSQKGTKYEK